MHFSALSACMYIYHMYFLCLLSTRPSLPKQHQVLWNRNFKSPGKYSKPILSPLQKQQLLFSFSHLLKIKFFTHHIFWILFPLLFFTPVTPYLSIYLDPHNFFEKKNSLLRDNNKIHLKKIKQKVTYE